MRGIADVLGFGEAWEKAGGFRMLRARGNHVNCMLMSSSGGRNIEAFQRNTLKPLGEIMRARSSGINPNRPSVALFAARALPVAGPEFPQDAPDQEEEQATAAPAQVSPETTELYRVTATARRTQPPAVHCTDTGPIPT